MPLTASGRRAASCGAARHGFGCGGSFRVWVGPSGGPHHNLNSRGLHAPRPARFPDGRRTRPALHNDRAGFRVQASGADERARRASISRLIVAGLAAAINWFVLEGVRPVPDLRDGLTFTFRTPTNLAVHVFVDGPAGFHGPLRRDIGQPIQFGPLILPTPSAGALHAWLRRGARFPTTPRCPHGSRGSCGRRGRPGWGFMAGGEGHIARNHGQVHLSRIASITTLQHDVQLSVTVALIQVLN